MIKINRILKIVNRVFYSTLGISLLLGIFIFKFGFFKNLYLLFGYTFLYLIIPLLFLSLATILFHNLKEFNFINGIKESSINIFSLIICLSIIWTLQSFAFKKNNQINVTFINKTEEAISDITLIGRNAMTKIDTLTPNQAKAIVFRGKQINYKTENDYENEIRLLYYFENKWRENKILSGFSRWRVIDRDWEIKIHDIDSIELKQIKKDI